MQICSQCITIKASISCIEYSTMSVQSTVIIDQNDLDENQDVVNPWEVKAESMSGVDYNKIIGQSMNFILEQFHWIFFLQFSSIWFISFNG